MSNATYRALLDRAVKITTENDTISSAVLQRMLKIDYPLAKRLINNLEEIGLVGPADGARPREVLKRSKYENADVLSPIVVDNIKKLPNKDGVQLRMTRKWLMYLQLFVPYVIAFAIWGLVFSNVFIGVIIGGVVGLVITFFSAATISKARTVEARADLIYAAGSLWGPPPVWIGLIGILVLVAKLIFKF